jgi:hypothetical protein
LAANFLILSVAKNKVLLSEAKHGSYILASFIFLSKTTNKKAEITAMILPKINGALTPI